MYPRRPTTPTTPTWFPWAVFVATAVVVMFIVPRFGWLSLLLFLWLGIPLLRRVLTSVSQSYAARTSVGFEKPKHSETGGQTDPWASASGRTYRAPSAHPLDGEEEKPKRRPEYTVGDDGELIEVEAPLEDERPGRSQSSGGSFYA